jgi:4-aminobutyrate aminotransferase-like enzyme
VIPAGTDKNIIRVLCPLVIGDELLNRGLDIMETQLRALCVAREAAAPLPLVEVS